MWPMLIGSLVGAGLGILKNKEAKNQQNAINDSQAAQTRYSWASGFKPGEIGKAPSIYGDILSGGLSGAAMGHNIDEMGKSAPKEILGDTPSVGSLGVDTKLAVNPEFMGNGMMPSNQASLLGVQNPWAQMLAKSQVPFRSY